MIAKQSKCSVRKTTVGNLLITQEINGTINDLREESFFPVVPLLWMISSWAWATFCSEYRGPITRLN